MTTINQSTSKTYDGIWVLFAVCLAALTLPFSFSGGPIATLSIGRELGGTAASLTWLTNAFMLTFGSLLMAAGTLADRFGRKRIFASGIILFVISSLASSFASSVIAIDLFRAVQGIGAAGALAAGSAAIAQEFDGHARVKAFSMLGTTFGIGLAFGPVLMGLLVEFHGWRSTFLATAVIGLIAIVVGLPRMRETRDPDATRLDWPGVSSFTAALSLFTFAIIQGPSFGWTNPLTIGLFVGAAAMLTLFLFVELRAERPMLDLSLFKYPRFVAVQLLPIATCYSYVVLLILLPLRFVGVQGMRETDAGLMMLALSAPMLVVPYLAASLAHRIAPRVLSAIGLLIAAAGVLWLGLTPPNTAFTPVAPLISALPTVLPMLMIGFGAAIPWGLMDGLSVTVVPKERAGMASGVFNTSKVANEGIALAVTSAVLGIFTAHGLRENDSVPDDRLHDLPEIAQRVVAGDLPHVLASLPQLSKTDLVTSYFQAFQNLSIGLAIITTIAAGLIFWTLKEPAKT